MGKSADCALFAHDEIRSGQREFCLDALSAAKGGRILLANAPTGVGKTAAALSAALEAALPAKRKVLFLTTRNSHHIQALIEARRIAELRAMEVETLKGERGLKVVDKVAKERMCLLAARKGKHKSGMVRCDYAPCRYSKPPTGAVFSILDSPMSASESALLGKERGFCAHFASLSAMEQADLVICDYSYLFDSSIREMFLSKMKCQLDRLVVIIDEAHNLPERIRAINEFEITEKTLKGAIRGLAEAKAVAGRYGIKPMQDDADSLISFIRETFLPNMSLLAKRMEEGGERQVGPGWLQTLSPGYGLASFVSADRLSQGEKLSGRLLRHLLLLKDEMLKAGENEEPEVEGLSGLRELAAFVSAAELAGEQHSPYGVFFRLGGEGGEYLMRAVLHDPAQASEEVFSQLHSAILMSGTLIGKEALVDLLGIERERVDGIEERAYESPFDADRHPVAIIPEASSRYSGRADPEKMGRMASAISRAASACHPGSLAIYYPSYEYLHMVKGMLSLPQFSHEVEMRGEGHAAMEERKKRIEREAGGGRPLILHGVIGGSYHEGVDFRDNPFKLIIIAGFPFPKPTASQVAYERYLAQKFDSRTKAEQYASLLPAAVKTVQAMGRGIRKDSDWCYALLVDDRFAEHLKFFPQAIRERAQLLSDKGAEVNVREFSRQMTGERE